MPAHFKINVYFVAYFKITILNFTLIDFKFIILNFILLFPRSIFQITLSKCNPNGPVKNSWKLKRKYKCSIATCVWVNISNLLCLETFIKQSLWAGLEHAFLIGCVFETVIQWVLEFETHICILLFVCICIWFNIIYILILS